MSGAAALGYQILWAKMFALTLGHEFPAVIAVVAAIFLGMAIGGALANQILARLGSAAFSKLELFIGASSLLTPLLILKSNLGWLSPAAMLPTAIAMGATLPAMAQLAKIPSAYAANTLGAVMGCLGAAYVLMPRLGLVVPVFVFAMMNFIAAFLARKLVVTETKASHLAARHAVVFFVTGFVGLGFEVLGVRLFSMSLENTVFTFAVILAVYLLGQAMGAAILRLKPIVTGGGLAVALGFSMWLFTKSHDHYESLRRAFGDSSLAVFGSELLTALAVFALPTLFMGGLFAQLAARAGQGTVGRSLFWNGLGAALGAIVVPLFFLPGAGAFRSLVEIPPGSTLRAVRVGRAATVAVTEAPDGNRTLFVNNRFQMGGTAATIPELRHAHIPMLLHPSPKSALVIGLGTGITLSGAAKHDVFCEGVELLPEVVAAMPHFFPNAGDSPQRATNVVIHATDARRFIRETDRAYDVIIADLFHPAQDGAGFLYTREHFQRIRGRLGEDGLFCQWLPLHQLDLQTLRDITRTFMSVFPNAEAWILRFNIDAPVIGLIGWRGERPALPANLVEKRLSNIRLGAELRRVALADSLRLYGCYLAGPGELRAFSGSARLNTDAFPLVMFEAPAFSYRRNVPTYERLVKLFEGIVPVAPPSIADAELQRRVAMFIRARDVYFRGLVTEAEGERDLAIESYIYSAKLSEDFTSGYAQCLAIATAESQSNPRLARRILERLVEAQPNRPVAKELLERMNRAP